MDDAEVVRKVEYWGEIQWMAFLLFFAFTGVFLMYPHAWGLLIPMSAFAGVSGWAGGTVIATVRDWNRQ